LDEQTLIFQKSVNTPGVGRNRPANPVVGVLLVAIGLASTALGIIGAFLPLLPTTPFLLLAAACFLRSSPRLHRWIHSNRFFGKYLEDFHQGAGLPLTVKISVLTYLWLSILAAVFFWIPPDKLWLRILLVATATAVSVHVARIRTKPARK